MVSGIRGTLHSIAVLFAVVMLPGTALASGFDFKRDTLAFANATVWDYREGIAHFDATKPKKQKRYTRHCFVMSRTVVQFYKFARFDPRGKPLDDHELVRRIRDVTRRPPWHDPLPEKDRIVFPGYADLRELSNARGLLLRKNIGLGWTAYLRVGNFRMFSIRGVEYQDETHRQLNKAMDRGKLFVAYLSDYPNLHINHAVLVYARRPGAKHDDVESYNCYDPNHPDGPRELKWLARARLFNFQKDQEFIGGYTRVYHVYGKALQ